MKGKKGQSVHHRKTKIMLSFGLLLILTSTFVACKKYSFNETGESNYLEVEEVNSSLLFHFSSTSDTSCGSSGYDLFNTYLSVFDSTEALATLTYGNVGGGNNDTIFEAHSAAFGVLNTSTFQANFNPYGISETVISRRKEAVIANANCKLTVGTSTLSINATAEFFQNMEGEDYYLTPYIVVDSLLAPQVGHPDSPLTYHRKVVVDVARLPNYPVRYLGYKIASGSINKGYKVNLNFEAYRDPAWSNPERISVILLLTKKDANGSIVFVNANTNN